MRGGEMMHRRYDRARKGAKVAEVKGVGAAQKWQGVGGAEGVGAAQQRARGVAVFSEEPLLKDHCST